MCRVPECGYDTGDCGTEDYKRLYGVMLSCDHHYIVPSGEHYAISHDVLSHAPHRNQGYVL